MLSLFYVWTPTRRAVVSWRSAGGNLMRWNINYGFVNEERDSIMIILLSSSSLEQQKTLLVVQDGSRDKEGRIRRVDVWVEASSTK